MAQTVNSVKAASSTKGMVATPHWLATEAGARVLKRGGNAIEAIVAAGAALSVLYPHFCGLGGDAIWITSDRSGKAKASWASATPQMPVQPCRASPPFLRAAPYRHF